MRISDSARRGQIVNEIRVDFLDYYRSDSLSGKTLVRKTRDADSSSAGSYFCPRFHDGLKISSRIREKNMDYYRSDELVALIFFANFHHKKERRDDKWTCQK